ncbi:MAG: hypothetical protein LZF60_340168 [Nitrospira sp.]|nr:MAG: hypothetical protein LZF60_340168 [Nitrospira sp.]
MPHKDKKTSRKNPVVKARKESRQLKSPTRYKIEYAVFGVKELTWPETSLVLLDEKPNKPVSRKWATFARLRGIRMVVETIDTWSKVKDWITNIQT